MKKLISNSIIGALIVALGVFVLLKPDAFLKTLVIVFGIYILLEGLSSVIYCFKLKGFKSVFTLSLIKALLNLFIGILVTYFAFTSDGGTVTTWVVYLIATELLLSGVLTVIDHFYLKKIDVLSFSFFLGSDAIVSIIFAILLYIFPSVIGSTFITILGVLVLLFGAVMVFSGILAYVKVCHLAHEARMADKEIDGEFSEVK
jgi:hypothetical protein